MLRNKSQNALGGSVVEYAVLVPLQGLIFPQDSAFCKSISYAFVLFLDRFSHIAWVTKELRMT